MITRLGFCALVAVAFCSVCVAAEELALDSMSTLDGWTLTGQRVHYVLGKSKLEAVHAPVRPGASGSLRLTYDLEQRSWVGLQWRGAAIPGRPQRVSFWLHGDGGKQRLAVHLEDAGEQTFTVPCGSIDWEGWRRIDLPMDPAGWQPLRRHGEEPQPVRWPVTFREIRVQKQRPEPLLGSIAVADLRAQCAVQRLDRLVLRVACDAPAGVFYTPASALLRVTLENPTDGPLSGQLETLVYDWRGASRRFPHGTVAVAAGAKHEQTLRIPLTELGSYTAWVRLCDQGSLRESARQFAISRKAPGAPPQDLDSPFGMGLYLPRFHNDAELAQALTLAREAGVKWTRGDLSPARLQPQPGHWAWEHPRWVAGVSGRAIEFSAHSPLRVESSATLNRPCESGELTLAFRIRFVTFDYQQRWMTLLGKGEGPHRQFRLFWTVPQRQLGISFGDGAKGWSDALCTKSDWKPGEWRQVVLTHRRADRSVRWWVDGVAAGEVKVHLARTLVANDLPLELGLGMDFALDDLALYDRCCTPAELAAAQPVARWTFDEGAGLQAADASGHANHARAQPLHQDVLLEQAARAGIASYAVVMGTPAWMVAKPNAGVERPWNLPPRLDAWSTAMEQLAGRYSQRGLRVWEVWNEPNIESFWSPHPDPEEYYQVLAAAYQAIKKADPQATVLGCALAGPHGPKHRPPYEFVEEVLRRGGTQVMDAISIHPYRQPQTPEDSQYVEDLRTISDLTAKYGRRLPIWITEVGWPNGVGGSSAAASAKLLVRSYLLALAEGVRNIAWYDYHDDGQDPSYNEHNFGILRHDLSPKPAYFAFRAMATELAGMRFVRALPVRDDVSALDFARGARHTLVAWAHHRDVPLALRIGGGKSAECVDLMGNVTPRALHNGVLWLTLSDAPLFLRDVGPQAEAILPIETTPAVLKLPRGENGMLAVTFRNPLSEVLDLQGPAPVHLTPRGTQTVHLPVPAAADWKPPIWKSRDGAIELAATARVIAVQGQRAPLLEHQAETNRSMALPNSSAASARDEVTIACCLRSDGPADSWQAPVTKWKGESTRSYGLYLGREKGELHFSASFAKGPGAFSDVNSGHGLFDGRWHRLVVTYSMHDAEVCFYIDGALVKRQPFDGGELAASDVPVNIAGGFQKTANGKPRPVAAVREVRVWNRALSAAEALALPWK